MPQNSVSPGSCRTLPVVPAAGLESLGGCLSPEPSPCHSGSLYALTVSLAVLKNSQFKTKIFPTFSSLILSSLTFSCLILSSLNLSSLISPL